MTEVNMIITSLTNTRIKEICKLKEKKYRNMTNTFLIEGINLVTEASKRNLLKEINTHGPGVRKRMMTAIKRGHLEGWPVQE